MNRYEITCAGHYLARKNAPTAEAAKLALIAERGYSYYTPDSLKATDVGFANAAEAWEAATPEERLQFAGCEWSAGRFRPVFGCVAESWDSLTSRGEVQVSLSRKDGDEPARRTGGSNGLTTVKLLAEFTA